MQQEVVHCLQSVNAFVDNNGDCLSDGQRDCGKKFLHGESDAFAQVVKVIVMLHIEGGAVQAVNVVRVQDGTGLFFAAEPSLQNRMHAGVFFSVRIVVNKQQVDGRNDLQIQLDQLLDKGLIRKLCELASQVSLRLYAGADQVPEGLETQIFGLFNINRSAEQLRDNLKADAVVDGQKRKQYTQRRKKTYQSKMVKLQQSI